MQCEVLDAMRSAFEDSSDDIWLRRNYLFHFISRNIDLQESETPKEFIVTEDDPSYDIEGVHGLLATTTTADGILIWKMTELQSYRKS